MKDTTSFKMAFWTASCLPLFAFLSSLAAEPVPWEGNEAYFLEAEEADLPPPFVEEIDADASNGQYIWVPDGEGFQDPPAQQGHAKFRLNNISEGSYHLWGRFIAPDTDSNSVYVKVNDEDKVVWEVPVGTAWYWEEFQSLDLDFGNHEIVVKWREDGVKLDKLILAQDTNYQPSGMGEPPEYRTPGWWERRGVLSPNASPDEHAIATVGQLKHIAVQAHDELEDMLPGGAGSEIQNKVDNWIQEGPSEDDLALVNLGQVKHIASLFYDRLEDEGVDSGYPWPEDSPYADDYALANLGQVKYLFSFDLDTDNDGLPDWWEMEHFGHLGHHGDDMTIRGIRLRYEYLMGLTPEMEEPPEYDPDEPVAMALDDAEASATVQRGALLAYVRWINYFDLPDHQKGLADSPSDQFFNLEKYALQFDPTVQYSSSLKPEFSLDWEYNGNSYPGFRVLRNTRMSSVEYTLERSKDLGDDWEEVPQQEFHNHADFEDDLPTALPRREDLEWVELLDMNPPDADMLFYRLRTDLSSWKTYFVEADVEGSNETGTIDGPFEEIDDAKNAVRSDLEGDQQGDIYVYIRGGTYRLDETLEFQEADGGQGNHRIIYTAYPEEDAVISGGRTIDGWSYWQDGMWRAEEAHGKQYRQLYVDGRRATRARSPFYRDVNGEKLEWIAWEEEEWEDEDGWEDAKIGIPSETRDWWANQPRAEIIVQKHWNQSRFRIETFDGDSVIPKNNEQFVESEVAWPPRKGGEAFYFENALELLTDRGEWYHDRDAEDPYVYYKPLNDENPNEVEVVSAELERLVGVNGARNITFSRLQLEHTSWNDPDDEGFVGQQAASYYIWNDGPGGEYPITGRTIPSGITVEDAEGVRFEENRIQHFGGGGIAFYSDTLECEIVGNVISDIDSNGISIYSRAEFREDIRGYSILDLVRDNFVTRVGEDYSGAVAIWASFPEELVIEHNEVYDVPYTGISLGWPGGGEGFYDVWNNTIRANRVEMCMRQHDDGAGIYTFNQQEETLVERNDIVDLKRNELAQNWAIAGLYLDQYSSNITMWDNVIRERSEDEKPKPVLVHRNQAAPDCGEGAQQEYSRFDAYAYNQEHCEEGIDVGGTVHQTHDDTFWEVVALPDYSGVDECQEIDDPDFWEGVVDCNIVMRNGPDIENAAEIIEEAGIRDAVLRGIGNLIDDAIE